MLPPRAIASNCDQGCLGISGLHWREVTHGSPAMEAASTPEFGASTHLPSLPPDPSKKIQSVFPTMSLPSSGFDTKIVYQQL